MITNNQADRYADACIIVAPVEGPFKQIVEDLLGTCDRITSAPNGVLVHVGRDYVSVTPRRADGSVGVTQRQVTFSGTTPTHGWDGEANRHHVPMHGWDTVSGIVWALNVTLNLEGGKIR